jgi:uncharacterized protein (DUF58 family)
MLPSEIAAQVRRIQFVTGRQVADTMSGAYLSVFKGRGMEFDEVRPYVPGDDIRTIDWNVTARTGEPYVKRYVEERELTVMLLVDVSASLDFGSERRSKREAATELSALLAFSAIQNDDKVGLLLFHGQADEYIPPRKGQKHALRVIREVLARGQEDGPSPRNQLGAGAAGEAGPRSWNPFGLPRAILERFRRLKARTSREPRRGTSIAYALEFCQRVLPRKTVLFLVSDFLDEGYLDALRHANRRHDVVCVHVGDAREATVQAAGLITVEDAETGERRLIDTESAAFRAEVARAAEERSLKLERELRVSGIDLIRIDATRPVVDPLLAFFAMRKRRLSR